MDEQMILARLHKMITDSPAPQMRRAGLSTAMAYIQQAGKAGKAWMVDGYLVLYDIGSEWYLPEQYLIEQLVLKVYRNAGPVASAVTFLEERAKFHKCVAIVAGDTQIGLMAPHYQAAGFFPLGTQFYKELQWDSSAS